MSSSLNKGMIPIITSMNRVGSSVARTCRFHHRSAISSKAGKISCNHNHHHLVRGHLIPSTRSFSNSTDDTLTFLSMQKLASKLKAPRPLRKSSQSIGSNQTPENVMTETATELNQCRGELARKICAGYCDLPSLSLPLSKDCERGQILMFLAMDCFPRNDDVEAAVERYHRQEVKNSIKEEANAEVYSNLRKATTPQYEEVLEYILEKNAIQGMSFLLRLREDLLRVMAWMKSMPETDKRLPYLIDLDRYLRRLFCTWFSPGMLEVKRITYENTSASVIERIVTKEAVHPLNSLDDLHRRLGPDRRVFAFFHPLLPNEPLIFVHVALKSDIPSSMEEIREYLSLDDASIKDSPKVATFYSISNAQPGLAGVGLASVLLKECIQLLRDEFFFLETFVTLSPLPRFRKWLEAKISQNTSNDDSPFFDDTLITEEDLLLLRERGLLSKTPTNRQEAYESFLELLKETSFSSNDMNATVESVLNPILKKLVARYLVLEKHRGKPLDVVARFHIANGAELYQINYAADTSRKGIQNSFGMMVNYRYDLPTVPGNQQKFELDYTLSVSPQVSKLIRGSSSILHGKEEP